MIPSTLIISFKDRSPNLSVGCENWFPLLSAVTGKSLKFVDFQIVIQLISVLTCLRISCTTTKKSMKMNLRLFIRQAHLVSAYPMSTVWQWIKSQVDGQKFSQPTPIFRVVVTDWFALLTSASPCSVPMLYNLENKRIEKRERWEVSYFQACPQNPGLHLQFSEVA